MDAKSETYHVPGFRWVRGFSAAILMLSLLLMSGVFGLITLAEMDVTVNGSGSIEPIRRSRIKSSLDGTIRTVLVNSGDHVVEGQVVAELDDTTIRSQLLKVGRDLESNRLRQEEFVHRRKRDLALYEAERVKANARVETASLQLEQVSREYRLYYQNSPSLKHRRRDSVETLLPVRIREAIYQQSVAELEAVMTKVEALNDGKLELRRLKADAKKLEQDRFLLRHRLDATMVRAGVKGTVLTREVEQLIGNQVKKGESFLEVAELGRWQVKTMVGELEFPKVRIGQEAHVYLEAFPYTEYKVFRGRVSHLPGRNDRAAESGAPVNYPVLVSVDDRMITDGETEYALSYGMKAKTKIVVERGRVIEVLWRQLLRSVGRLAKPELRFSRRKDTA